MPHDRIKAVDPRIRDLGRSLTDAQDSQIVRVVGLIDHLPDRSGIDALVDTVRPRLARLRPQRPLRFARLLFMPLDPVIVPPATWRRGMPAIPRSALPALAATVRAVMRDRAEAIDAMIVGRPVSDTAVIAAAGPPLWSEASAILRTAPDPVDWHETSLNIAVYPFLARVTAAILSQAEPLDRLARETTTETPSADLVLAIVHGACAVERDALPLLLAVMMWRAPMVAATLADLARSTNPNDAVMRPALEQASGSLLDRLQTDGALDGRIVQADLAEAAATVRQLGRLLRGIEAGSAGRPPLAHLNTVRKQIETACRVRFSDGLTRDFLVPLQGVLNSASDQDVAALEEVARGLRTLETEARVIGSVPSYDQLLAQTAHAIVATPTSDTFDAADKARLLEIMTSPEAAWTMFMGGGAPTAIPRS